MKYLYILQLFFALPLLISCSPMNQTLNEAKEYEEAGLFRDAFSTYEQCYHEDNENHKAKEGLKRCSQKVYSQLLDDADMYYGNEMYNSAHEKYLEAFDLKDRNNGHKISLSTGYSSMTNYRKLNNRLAEQAYNNAVTPFRSGDYTSAIPHLEKAVSYNADFDTAKMMLDSAMAAVHYDDGMTYFLQGDYKKAWVLFKKANKRIYNFNDVRVEIRKCIDEAKMRVAIFPIINLTNVPSLEDDLYKEYINCLNKQNKELLAFCDCNEMQKIIRNFSHGSALVRRGNEALDIGRKAGLARVILVEITGACRDKGNISKEPHTAYEFNDELKASMSRPGESYYEITSKETQYNRVIGSNEASLEIQIELFDVATSKKISCFELFKEHCSEVDYIDYKGNPDKVVTVEPPKTEEVIDDLAKILLGKSWRNAKLTGNLTRQDLIPVEILMRRCTEEIAEESASRTIALLLED